jgi:DNA-binding MarR family transcriptional regulator
MVDDSDPAAGHSARGSEALNRALELLHFGFRAITAEPDERLRKLGYSRVHHRLLYFIGRNEGCSQKQLLRIMRVSRQYLHRPLKQLIDAGFVEIRRDEEDARVRRLRLSPRGRRLEQALTGRQREQLAEVFRQAGAEAERGWREVMALLARGLPGPS